MKDDSYACGAIVVAESLRKVATKYPIWCMVSDGVSADCEEMLTHYFDNVVRCPLVSYPTVNMKSKKQNEIYGSWIHMSFTKWNVLCKDYFPVDKVILLDADMMIFENIDDLFDLPGPALTFSSPWAHPYVKGKKFKGSYNPFGEMQHGSVVDRRKIIRGFSNGILGLGCMVLVEPCNKVFAKMMEILKKRPVYGITDCISGFDEQLIAETLLTTGRPIYHIHQSYNWIVGKTDWLLNGEKPKTQQFYNGKPWLGVTDEESYKRIVENSEWQDVRDWWVVANKIIADAPPHIDMRKWFWH
jgi:alpha-N-acetylglucosamine transferase